MSNKITVTVINNRGYIFNAKDYIRLRSHHRILGKLIGCVVSCPRNSTVNGLPAILSDHELRFVCTELLHHNDIEVIERGAELCDRPTDANVLNYRAFRAGSVGDQQQQLRHNKVAESRKVVDQILAGKRKKLTKAGATAAELAALSADQVLQDIYNGCAVVNEDNTLVQVPTQHPFNDIVDSKRFNVDECADETARLEYRVFKDLWLKGKYITAGDTFGGDFLVYPGDPMYCHASHIIHCIGGGGDDGPAAIPTNRLVAYGRLSVLVNKSCVFAYVSSDDELCYQSMEWMGKTAAASFT